ncbi:MAG: hypothetical protein ACLR3C_03440 [Eggerthella lenta]
MTARWELFELLLVAHGFQVEMLHLQQRGKIVGVRACASFVRTGAAAATLAQHYARTVSG